MEIPSYTNFHTSSIPSLAYIEPKRWKDATKLENELNKVEWIRKINFHVSP